MTHHLAQINVARLRFPLTDPRMAEFIAVLEPVNKIAEVTPGFIWRLKTDDGLSATYAEHPFTDDVIVNFTVWESVEALKHFTYQSGHGAYFRRRSEWFEPLERPTTAMWWIPAGHTPTLLEAKEHYDHLVQHGSSEYAFRFQDAFPTPSSRVS
jgi:heme-degrading monooxygenase HmoA